MARITIKPARKWWASPLFYGALGLAVVVRPMIGHRRSESIVIAALGVCLKYGRK